MRPTLPKLEEIYLPPAAKMQGLAKGQGVVVTYYPSGPLLEYMPDRVKTPPKTAQELLDWAKANPNRFMYARPANSGPGRTFMMGLPYLLGDTDPKDPEKGWDKTWAYLKELGQYIEYYPTGTDRDDEGARRGLARHDRLDHRLGHQSARARHRAEGGGGHHARGLPLGLRRALHVRAEGRRRREARRAPRPDDASCCSPEQQANTYDHGYFYPGPAVTGVTLDMAPQESQDAIKEFGRPEYEELIADNPIELPLEAGRSWSSPSACWDEQVGAGKEPQ